MFMGHLGVALGAKGARKDVSLLLLCLAAVAPDLIDFTAMVRYPNGAGLWTHSIAAMVAYAVLFFAAYFITTRKTDAALIVGAVAASHVLLDLITSHMVLWQGGPPLGLHLYLQRLADLCLESAVVLAGWLWYVRSLAPQRRYSVASVSILVILLAMQGLMAMVKIA